MRQYYSTRQWQHPEGYKYLAVWSNAVLLRFLVRRFTLTLPSSEHRTKTQLDDACRSVVSNIEEGYKRPTTKEYLDFFGFSQGSLEEVKGLIKQVYQDGFLKSKPNSTLVDLGIDLKDIKGLLEESKGEIPLDTLYPPLKSLREIPLASFRENGVTYEMFMELVNKTDWLFRQTVASLEKKAGEEMPLSPREKWLKNQGRKQSGENRKMDEELKKIVNEERMKKGEKPLFSD